MLVWCGVLGFYTWSWFLHGFVQDTFASFFCLTMLSYCVLSFIMMLIISYKIFPYTTTRPCHLPNPITPISNTPNLRIPNFNIIMLIIITIFILIILSHILNFIRILDWWLNKFIFILILMCNRIIVIIFILDIM